MPSDVQVVYAHGSTVSHSFFMSYVRLFGYDERNNKRLKVGTYGTEASWHQLPEARNSLARYTLDHTDAQYMFTIDTDMGFAPDTVDVLLDASDSLGGAVVGALCFGVNKVKDDGFGGWRLETFPTMYDMGKEKDTVGYVARNQYVPNTLEEVEATGAACLLVPRAALEKVRDRFGDCWFNQVKYTDDRLVSEDLSFCYRLRQVAVQIFVHTGVKTSHHKELWITDDYYSPQ